MQLEVHVVRRASVPSKILAMGGEALARPAESLRSIADGLSGVAKTFSTGFGGASETPINVAIGPYRRFDWARHDLDVIKEIKNRLGGTLNDVVLCTVAGAMRRYFQSRQVAVDDLDFRVMMPVSLRQDDERGSLGNRIAFLMVPLPLDEPDPIDRLKRINEITQELKESPQIKGNEWIESLSNWTSSGLLSKVTQMASLRRSYNMVVTNVPGPQSPVYLLGARMIASYPLVPLFLDQGVGIALFSFDGGLYWGFNGDWETIPDLHDLVEMVEQELELLRKA